MRTLCICLISSLLASAFTVAWLSPDGRADAVADIGRQRGASPVEQVRPSLVRTFDLDGLTPEEAINVAVYEAVNRSVVPRQHWPERVLQAQDKVDIVRAIGGG